MTGDCCLSTNVWLVSGDSILVALATHQLQANVVTRYQLQVSTTVCCQQTMTSAPSGNMYAAVRLVVEGFKHQQ